MAVVVVPHVRPRLMIIESNLNSNESREEKMQAYLTVRALLPCVRSLRAAAGTVEGF